MAARTKARKRALDVLYECDLQTVPLGETLAGRVAEGDPPVNEYTVTLVEGVAAHQEQIDAWLSDHAVGWTLERMPAVDRNVLRIGAYEIIHADDVPDGVAVSEAVALAKDLSTDESPGFINGLLARLIEVKPSLPA